MRFPQVSDTIYMKPCSTAAK